MKQDYTDITILLDKSASMANRTTDTIGGVNKFMEDQLALPGQCNITVVQFAGRDDYFSKELSKLNEYNYRADGSATALIDSACRLIDDTGERLKAIKEEDRPARVIFVIVTDGQENDSRKFSKKELNAKITEQTNKYNWQFVFMGTNQDAITEAASYGIPSFKAMTYTNNSKGISDSYSATSNLVRSMRVNSVDTMSTIGYTVKDRKLQEDADKK